MFAFLAIIPLTVAVVPHASAAASNGLPNPPAANCAKLTSCDIISKYVDPAIAFLTALVGVGVVTSLIIGGIQYSSSGGDPGKSSAAKNRIRNALIALVTFILLSAMLNFLIPGGLL